MNYQEHYTQVNCINWIRSTYPFLGNLVYAVPNGQQRSASQAAVLKSEGLTRGVSDICLDLPNSTFHAMRIEMKTKKGTTTFEQDEYAMRCTAVGIYYCVVRSFEEFQKEVNEYLATVPDSTIMHLKSVDAYMQAERDKQLLRKQQTEARKAQKELQAICQGNRPSSSTESARKELSAFLRKHAK